MNTWDLILMGIQIGYNQRKIEEEGVPQEPIRPELITQVVTGYYGVTWSKLVSKNRKRELVQPRQVLMYLMSAFTQLSLSEVGIRLGGRDHTTVIHSREKVKDLMDTDENYRAEIQHLIKLISDGAGRPGIQPVRRAPKHRQIEEPRPKQIIRMRQEQPRITRRPAAEYSNSGHLNLLKRLA
jgi:hypothetical protein